MLSLEWTECLRVSTDKPCRQWRDRAPAISGFLLSEHGDIVATLIAHPGLLSRSYVLGDLGQNFTNNVSDGSAYLTHLVKGYSASTRLAYAVTSAKGRPLQTLGRA